MGPFLRQGGALALVLLFMAGVAIWVWWSEGERGRTLDSAGLTSIARVVDLDERQRRNPSNNTWSTDYWVSVRYNVGSINTGDLTIHSARDTVSRSFYEGLSVGDEIEVRYLAEDPDRVEIEPGGVSSNALAAGLVGLGMGVIGLGIIWLVRRHMKQMGQMLRDGTRVRSEIAEIVDKGAAKLWRLPYQHPPGVKQEVLLPAPNLRDMRTLPEGSEVMLLFHPDREKPVLEAVAKRAIGA